MATPSQHCRTLFVPRTCVHRRVGGIRVPAGLGYAWLLATPGLGCARVPGVPGADFTLPGIPGCQVCPGTDIRSRVYPGSGCFRVRGSHSSSGGLFSRAAGVAGCVGGCSGWLRRGTAGRGTAGRRRGDCRALRGCSGWLRGSTTPSLVVTWSMPGEAQCLPDRCPAAAEPSLVGRTL